MRYIIEDLIELIGIASFVALIISMSYVIGY